jgi:hypothetical protein
LALGQVASTHDRSDSPDPQIMMFNKSRKSCDTRRLADDA